MEREYTHFPLTKSLCISHLISLFYYKSPRNFQFEGEQHDFWEFIYIDKGKMLITAGNKQYVLRAGELAFHKPGEFHAVCAYEDIPSNFIISAFDCSNTCMRYFEHRILTLNSRERDYLYEAVRHGKQAFTTIQSPRSVSSLEISETEIPFGEVQIVQANLEMLLLTLLQSGDSVRIQPRVISYTEKTRYRQLTANVKNYLEEHIQQSLTLSKIGTDLGYSVPQMKKLFREETQRGIIDYFIDMKMDEAKRLIREGTFTITQIAAQLGYENVGYFSRLFKLREDMTPSEYSRSIG